MLESSFHDPLSAEINAATRSHHTILNRLITSRLPLCLPPHTSNPQVYAAGISQFAEIFSAFEELWDEITGTQAPEGGMDDTWEALDEQYPSPTDGAALDLISFLRTLRPPGLARSARVRKDLIYLQKSSSAEGDGISEYEQSEAVKIFIEHIRDTVSSNPHLLIAYAWTLYMAIFSGGRWVRAQLCSAGEQFWNAPPTTITSSSKSDKEKEKLSLEELMIFEPLGLSFWFFPSDRDGEDIKAEFKRRLQDGEHILTTEQRKEIVKEAQGIFDRFSDMVADLDSALAATSQTKEAAANLTVKEPKKRQEGWVLGYNLPSYAGLAFAVSCVSWYAMFYAETWY